MIGDHEKVVLQFSGGADSTALLWLARPYLARITVLFADTGSVFPHVVDHVFRMCKAVGARLEIVRPHVSVTEWHALRGLPADIVPEWATVESAMLQHEKPAQLIQPTLGCCATMLWAPKMAAVKALGATLVLRGSKQCDERVGARPGFVHDGIEYASPLWTWTDAEVLEFLRHEGVALPKHYEHVKDSLDCTVCTGHTGAHYARARYEYIRKHHPDVWAELAPKLATVRGIIEDETKRHSAAMAFDEEAA